MKKALEGKIWTAVIIGLTAVGLFLLFGFLMKSVYPNYDYQEYPGLINGEVKIDDGPWEPVDYETTIDETFHKVTFRGIVHPLFLENSEVLVCSKNVWYNLRYVGKTYAEGDFESGYDFESIPESELDQYTPGSIPSSPGYEAYYALLSKKKGGQLELQGKQVILEVRRPYPIATERFSDCFRVGVDVYNGVYREIVRNLLPFILLFVLFCFFGIFLFPVAGFIMGRANYRYLTFGAVCVSFGLYMIMQILGIYLNLWVWDSMAVMMADKVITYTLVITILCYLKAGLKRPLSRRLANLVITILFLAFASFAVLQLAEVSDMVETSVYAYPAILISFVFMIILLIVELRKGKSHASSPKLTPRSDDEKPTLIGSNTRRRELIFLLSWLPLLITQMIDILDLIVNIPGNNYFQWGLGITLIYQLVSIVVDLRRQYKESIRYQKMQRELYEAEVSQMVSQIRPHFVYNTLSSIAVLCKLDPDTAYEATVNFSDYLRGNMDSLKQKEPVPFSRELEHLKKYLYIEKLRFQERLNIVYDIQTEDFCLPLLSIQPLAENAVKHGVGMKKEGGTVTIATRDTGESIEIIVRDDGVGFDMNAPREDSGRSHIGTENTKKRIEEMCGGTMTIESKPGEGTTVKILLPKKNEGNTDSHQVQDKEGNP